MKKNKLVLIALSGLLVLAAGCGRNYAGAFTGTQNISSMLGSYSVVVSAQLTQSGNSVTGILTAQNPAQTAATTAVVQQTGVSGTMNGTVNGDSVNWTLISSNAGSLLTGAYCPTTYTGIGSMTPDSKTYTVTFQGAAQATSYGVGTNCVNTFTLILNRTN